MIEIQFADADQYFDAHVIFTIEVEEKDIENFMDELGSAALRITDGKYENFNKNGEFILKGFKFRFLDLHV